MTSSTANESADQLVGATPKVLIIHDFAETFGGAERIAGEIANAFPGSELIAIAGRDEVAKRMGMEGRFSTLLPRSEWLLRHYRKLAPGYPLLAAARSLPEADLLISSSYAFAHGFQTVNGAPHLSYCCSPLRFAWTMADDYGDRLVGPRLGSSLGKLSAPFRVLDRRASKRVDRYLAESGYVADQIQRFFNRDATVLHPPVDCERFSPGTEDVEDYVLLCGRLIEPYKRPNLVVEAFRAFPERRLVVAGDGPELPRLREIAPSNVEFVGQLEDEALIAKMRRCSFAIFPSRDDFGLVPVEVMACGRPVLASAEGGALETVRPGVTGELFSEPTVEGVVEAIRQFDPSGYDTDAIREHALGWDVRDWRRDLRNAAADLLQAV
ncbi:MAG: glycosyltransferase [Solirubrobacterales bacterium]